MKSFFAFLGVLLVAFLGLGLYFGWFSFKTEPAGEPGHTRFEVDINGKKIKDDVQHGVDAGSKAVHGAINQIPSSKDSKSP